MRPPPAQRLSLGALGLAGVGVRWGDSVALAQPPGLRGPLHSLCCLCHSLPLCDPRGPGRKSGTPKPCPLSLLCVMASFGKTSVLWGHKESVHLSVPRDKAWSLVRGTLALRTRAEQPHPGKALGTHGLPREPPRVLLTEWSSVLPR